MKEKLFIIFIVLISALPPLSIDLPLPALPEIALVFGVEESVSTMLLTAFFITFAIATLVWGPLSDKYGRKPMLLIGFALYFIGSVLCGLANSIDQIIIFRVLQGIGGGCSVAISSAIVRDAYSGRRQEGVLAVVQSMMMICPLVAPVLGALLQNIMTWRGIFYAQAAMGLIIIIGTIIMKETITEKTNASVLGALSRLWPVFRHGKFALMVITFSLPFFCNMAWVSVSAYIFVNFFGLSNMHYSYFFAFTCLGAVFGPVIYMMLSRKFNIFNIIAICFAEFIVAGFAVVVFGHTSPWCLALLMMPTMLFMGAMRTRTNYMMLNNMPGDTGSASSLLNAIGSIFGTVGMLVISLFTDYIAITGILFGLVGIACLLVWIISFKYTKYEEKIQ